MSFKSTCAVPSISFTQNPPSRNSPFHHAKSQAPNLLLVGIMHHNFLHSSPTSIDPRYKNTHSHMERFVPFPRTVPFLAVAVFVFPVYGQINTACTASVLATFAPCMSFLTSSAANGSSPTAGCCGSLKNLTSDGIDCLCLVVTGSVPFGVPINRTLAISLPRACNVPGVPVQCEGTYYVKDSLLFSN